MSALLLSVCEPDRMRFGSLHGKQRVAVACPGTGQQRVMENPAIRLRRLTVHKE